MAEGRAKTDQFQLRMPPGLRDRIKLYAERNRRSLNEEIVRVLEKEFPEPWPLERRMAELFEIIKVLKAGKVEAVDMLLSELGETILAVRTGRLEGLTDDERDRIDAALEAWREEQVKYAWIDEPELDGEEQEMLERTGGTEKFATPRAPKTNPVRDTMYLMEVLPAPVLAEITRRLSEADTQGAADVLAKLPRAEFAKFLDRVRSQQAYEERPPSDDPF